MYSTDNSSASLITKYNQEINVFLKKHSLSNDIFSRYFKLNIQEKIELKTKENNTSIGIIYLLLTEIDSSSVEEKTRIKIAAQLEILFIITNLLDNIFDQDEKNNAISDEENILNLLHYLFLSISQLSTFSANYFNMDIVLNYLSSAMDGERYDYYSTISHKTDEAIYFDKMLDKSTFLMKIVTYLAFPSNKNLHTSLGDFLATSFQLQNDAFDAVNLSKSDLYYFKETLPLIKAFEYAKKEQNTTILDIFYNQKNDTTSAQKLIHYIIHSHAIDYTLDMSKAFIRQMITLLESCYPKKHYEINQFISYITEKGENQCAEGSP